MAQLNFVQQTRILEYHAGMLGDRERVDGYRRAIHEVVSPGDVVVDLGTGTGVLAYFACQAGAERVYAIDSGVVLVLADEIRAANGLQDRVVLVRGDSRQVTLPERADVLVTETLWDFGVGEGMLGAVADARARHLKPGARIVPEAVAMVAGPIEDEDLYGRTAGAPDDVHGLDFGPLRSYAPSNVYIAEIGKERLLADPGVLQSFPLGEDSGPELAGSCEFTARRDGTVHGFAGWFSAQLSPSVILANGPLDPPTSWSHAFLPLERPLAVSAGDRIALDVQTTANGSVWRWACTHATAGAAMAPVADQTSFFGFPWLPPPAEPGTPLALGDEARTRPAEG